MLSAVHDKCHYVECRGAFYGEIGEQEIELDFETGDKFFKACFFIFIFTKLECLSATEITTLV
jgi:hypothetical protein